MIHLTKPDVTWLVKLLQMTIYIQKEYPELFSDEDEEVLLIVTQLIKELTYEDINI